MAEFCPECWNKLNNFSDPAESYRLSWGYELCEGCSEFKRVVVGKRKHYWHLIVLKNCFKKEKAIRIIPEILSGSADIFIV